MRTTRDLILLTVGDLVSNFLYYDRKEDEELPQGAINAAIENGVMTVDDIVAEFRRELERGLDK